LVAACGLYSGTPCCYCHRPVGRLGFDRELLWVVIVLHGLFCVRSVPLTADKLRQVFSDQELDSSGPVRSLRQGLADHIKRNMMQTVGDEDVTQASVPTDLVHNVMEPVPPKFGDSSHGGGGDSQTQVLVELLRQVSPLSSEEPEAILRLFVRLEEVHDLGLVDDRVLFSH